MAEDESGEIEERLGQLDSRQLLALLEKLSKSDELTEAEQQEFAECAEELRSEQDRFGRLLREHGQEIIRMLSKALDDDALMDELTDETREQLSKTLAQVAGYQFSFWLPSDMGRRVLMFAFIGAGVLGSILWSWWCALLLIVGAAFSPRLVGEVLVAISKPQ